MATTRRGTRSAVGNACLAVTALTFLWKVACTSFLGSWAGGRSTVARVGAVAPSHRRSVGVSPIASAAIESGKLNLGVDAKEGEPLPFPEAVVETDDETKAAIESCLEDGCSVEAMMKLDSKLASEEKKILAAAEEFKAAQKVAYNQENGKALAWMENLVRRTSSLRAQLQTLKTFDNTDLLKQLVRAASVAFGGGRSTDYPKVGVASYSVLPESS